MTRLHASLKQQVEKMISSLPYSLLLLFQFISVILVTYFALQLLNFVTKAKGGKTVINPPPGSYGLPLIGETLAFVRANNSSKGFYDFVQKRHSWYFYVLGSKYVQFLCSHVTIYVQVWKLFQDQHIW